MRGGGTLTGGVRIGLGMKGCCVGDNVDHHRGGSESAPGRHWSRRSHMRGTHPGGQGPERVGAPLVYGARVVVADLLCHLCQPAIRPRHPSHTTNPTGMRSRSRGRRG